MMKMKTAKATTGLSHMNGGSAGGGGELEVRPEECLVQKRDPILIGPLSLHQQLESRLNMVQLIMKSILAHSYILGS
ncbi:hypothetical protein NC651_029394 [Populus alba x Populus x berolinensis]|nr:hypothetical protein NC651_029394 [Populus alba x Populus x berolinensis]